MCLTCLGETPTLKTNKEIKRCFKHYKNSKQVCLKYPDNKELYLNNKQMNEISKEAIGMVAYSIDSNLIIFAIQWKNSYKVKTF